MRKILITVLVTVLFVGTAFFMVNWISKINVKGIKAITDKDTAINNKISELSNLINTKYASTESNLKSAANTLQGSKAEYENQAILSQSSSSSYASQLEKYDIDYLWTILGNYARDENVIIRIDLVSGGASANLYNLNFEVKGDYVNITNFIYDIENDSKLGFKIDEFKMQAIDSTTLGATFSCKEVPINVGTIDQASSNVSDSDDSSGNQTSSNTAGASSSSSSSNSSSSNSSSSSSTSASSNTASNTKSTAASTN